MIGIRKAKKIENAPKVRMPHPFLDDFVDTYKPPRHDGRFSPRKDKRKKLPNQRVRFFDQRRHAIRLEEREFPIYIAESLI